MNKKGVSVVIPAKDEADSLNSLLPELNKLDIVDEIILVNDGSKDNTSELCKRFNVREIVHPYSKGNGAAIKSGARAAEYDVIVFMDADGQHDPADIATLLERLEQGYDMVVGARDRKSQATMGRWMANLFYNEFASWMSGRRIKDLTSGFRAVRTDKFREFLYLLPNGFSYPTTSTMAFFRAGYSVDYVSINVAQRTGKSHINLMKDGIRFLLIIFKVGSLYSPLKLFAPMSFFFFLLGVTNYAITYIAEGRFTNMSALLFITSLLIFLIGLVSEQITSLLYAHNQDRNH